MKILLTGGSSGVGQSLLRLLTSAHTVDCPSRCELDLADADSVTGYVNSEYDMLINCAGTGIGGKVDFVNHAPGSVRDILNTNLLGAVLLTQQVLKHNSKAKIVNITSTNNNRYYANDLIYSLSKKSLETFGNMLRVEYPSARILEIRLGLTKTNFNRNRYRLEPNRYQDIYQHPHLTADQAAESIVDVLFNDHIKYLEVSP